MIKLYNQTLTDVDMHLARRNLVLVAHAKQMWELEKEYSIFGLIEQLHSKLSLLQKL
jgi:hypothetical protein